ncbi:MAG: hypothetical protein ACJA2G_002954 [Cognaticolwellia sp.]
MTPFLSVASATLIESINNLNPGEKYRVLFVTSTVREADSTNIDDYNNFVTNAANAGSITSSLGGTWAALASTESDNAQTNTRIFNNDNADVSFFNTAGTLVARSGSDLWDGGLLAPIGYDEEANAVNLFIRAFTGTGFTGETFRGSELGTTGGMITGKAQSKSGRWMGDHTVNYARLSLYGVSSMRTVAAVPEPGTVILLLLGLAGLFMSHHRKQY